MRKKLYTNEEALAALQKNREEGLQLLFNEYYTPLCFFVARLTGDTTIAEEISADVFIKIWARRHELSTAGSIKALLYQMARNAAIDYLRKQKRMAVHEKGLHYLPTLPEQNVLQKITETELLREIVATLEKLPPGCSEVFKLSYLFGKTDGEIAKQLKLSHHTVRNQKLRAIRLLKNKISPLIIILLFAVCLY